jgi:hypothetical protein
MFAGSCHDWRLQFVFQCRVQVTRIWGNIQVMSPMQPMCVFYLLRKYTFYVFYRNEIICDFLIEPMIYIYIYMSWMFWVVSSMLKIMPMILLQIELCVWSVVWIVI